MNVEEARARFSEPGFARGRDVGFFVKFVGMPAGDKTLRIWWDYEGDFNAFEDIDIGDGDVNPIDPSVFDTEMVVEHTYNVGMVMTKRVRVELIIDGRMGNCARNRDVVVSPERFDHMVTFHSVPVCNKFPGNAGMFLVAKISPPIPVGTKYFVTARVSAPAPAFSNMTILTFHDGSLTDANGPYFQFSAPPNTFSGSLTATVPHTQLLANVFYTDIGVFTIPVPLTTKFLRVEVPGKTVGYGGVVAGTCR